jgi:HSP20 family protein
VRSEFDHLLDDVWTRPVGLNLTRRIQALSGPALELKNKETEFELVAETPGMKAEDIELKVSDGILRLTGETRGT